MSLASAQARADFVGRRLARRRVGDERSHGRIGIGARGEPGAKGGDGSQPSITRDAPGTGVMISLASMRFIMPQRITSFGATGLPFGVVADHVTTRRRDVLHRDLVLRATVFALDPTTGGLAGATRFAETSGNDVRREDLRFGRLWLFGLGFGKPSALSWGTFDLASGAVSRVSGEMESSDVTASGWPTSR